MRDNLINDNTPVTRAQMAAYSDELQAVADGFEAAKREYLQGQCSMFEAAPDMNAALGSGNPSDPDSGNTIPADPAASPACVAFSSQDFDATCQDPLVTSSPIYGVCTVNSGPSSSSGSTAVSSMLFATAAMSGDDVAPFFDNEFAVNYRKDRGSQRT